MEKVISIGKQNFASLRENHYFFVDKSHFIKDWWENGDEITLITRPRRFGKTLNMSMLDCFFSNKYADRGELFEGLEIWEDEKYREIQGTYPVIFLSFAAVKADQLSEAKIQIKQQIARVYEENRYLLDGDLLSGNEHGYFVKGKVVVASGDDEVMKEYIEEDDLVILANRPESQRCALELNASCIVVCTGTEVSEEILAMAKERDCVVIRTPFDSFTAARLINQSMPIKYFMKKDNLVTFELEDYVDDVKEEMAKVRHRDFPVLDENGNYVGMISRRNLLNMKKKQVILVDHNEKTQAVDGIDGAEILEIIDHHRIGNLETVAPVFFRNQPLGCTGTIIYQMYQEQNEEITKKVAGLLLSAILSDTLMFRSPTCTPVDKAAAEELAKIADVDIETHAKNMFRAGSNFKNKTIEEIFFQDFKKFTAADKDFGVGQISAMGAEELLGIKDQIVAYMDTVLTEKKLNMVFIMLTDILEETTYLLCAGTGADQVAEEAFKQEKDGDYYVLKGVVSRKKQIIPPFMSVLQ